MLLIAIAKKSTLTTIVPRVALFCVILPYAFLMNTSHNKNRIIEVGWKNIIKNIIGQYKGIDVGSERESEQKTSQPSTTDSTSKDCQNQQKGGRRETTSVRQKQIFVVSKDVYNNPTKVSPNNDAPSTSGVSKDQTSTTGVHCQYNDTSASLEDSRNIPKLETCISSSDEETDISYNMEDVSKILVELMLDNLNDEDVYTMYLKKLIKFHDGGQNGKYYNKDTVEMLIHTIPTTTIAKKHKIKGKGTKKVKIS